MFCFLRSPRSTPYPFMKPLTTGRPSKRLVETVTKFPYKDDEENVIFVDGIPTSMHDLTQTPKVSLKNSLKAYVHILYTVCSVYSR